MSLKDKVIHHTYCKYLVTEVLLSEKIYHTILTKIVRETQPIMFDVRYSIYASLNERIDKKII